MILVTTPTGNTGAHLIRHLATSGHAVTALARHPEKIPAALREKITVIEGSLLDEGAFAHAAEGCHDLYFVVPPADDAEDVIAYYEQFARAAVQAAQRGGIRRIVYLSGAGKTSPFADAAGAATALFRAEDILMASGLAVRALRCPVFYESILWQIAPITHASKILGLLPRTYRHGQVGVRDIATCAAHYLTQANWDDAEGVGVFGPEDVCMDDIVAAIGTHIGKQVHYEQLSPEAYRQTLRSFGVAPALAQAVTDMFTSIGQGLFASERRDAEPKPVQSMNDWIRDVFVPIYRQPSH